MAARFARGRFGAACIVGLLGWLAAAGLAFELRAQEFAGEWTLEPESAPSGWEAVDAANYGCNECGYGCDSCGCGDGCDGSHMQDCDCGCCFPYTSTQRWWFMGELLLWRVDGARLAPLVTESPDPLPPRLNLPTTDVIAGGNVTGNSWRTGYRLELGVWFDDCQETALIGDYFNVGQDDYDYFFPGNSGRVVGRPYFDAEDGDAAARIISEPGEVDGTISVTADDDFQGAGLTLQQRVYLVGDAAGYGPSTQVMVLGGYRFFSYDSQLSIHDYYRDDNGQSYSHDLFNTDNEFHGGEIGVLARFTQTGCWFDGSVRLAIGGHEKRATVNGSTATIPNGMPVEFAEGGLLTSSETNIGTYTDSRFRFIPTFRLEAGVYLTPQWTFQAGYTAIIWGGVARAAALTPPDLAVDPRNIPPVMPGGGASPFFPGIGGSELVAHGLDLGIEYRY